MSGRITTRDFTQIHYRSASGLRWIDPKGDYPRGAVHTDHGLVEVYGDRKRREMLLVFLHGGRTYHRNWKTLWGDLTIARLAREFAEDVTTRGETLAQSTTLGETL